MRALAKQPEQRFPTIWDFALALEQASQQVQAAASPLYLAGNGSSHNQVTVFAARTQLASPPSPMAVPQPVPTVAVESSEIASQPVHPRLSRRAFVGSIIGLTAIGGGTAGVVVDETGKRPGHITRPSSYPYPYPHT